MTDTPTTAAEIGAWLTDQIAGILSVPEDDIDPDATFDSFGLASRDAVSLSGDLEDYLNLRLSPVLLYQHPTIRKLSEHLAEELRLKQARIAGQAGQQRPAASIQEAKPVVHAAIVPELLTQATVVEMSDAEAEAALLKKLVDLGE